MKIVLIILMIFILGALFVISNNSINFSESGDAETFFEEYFDFIRSIFYNFFPVTNQVINIDVRS